MTPRTSGLYVAGFLMLVYIVIFPPAFSLPDIIDQDTVDLKGDHVVILRSEGQMDADVTAVIGSQDLEDAATESGGNYALYYDHYDPSQIADIYKEPVAQMQDMTERPVWWLYSETTNDPFIQPVPGDLDLAIDEIKKARGAR